jgi:N-formylglutamate amidohydrolase
MQPFTIHTPTQADISAVVFDSPHSGIILPDHFRYACTRQDLMFLHDPHVEKLLIHAPLVGVPVLEALIHRTCIDLNRYDDEIDPAMITGDWPHAVRQTFYTDKKLGLFPMLAGPRSNRLAPIYNDAAANLDVTEADYRINTYHRPYYAALNTLLKNAHDRHGHAIHINVHSFDRTGHDDMADVILGDMNGTLCAQDLTDCVRANLESAGYKVDFNGTYFSGGALVQTTGKPGQGYHSLQIEFARDRYLSPDTLAFDPVRASRVRHALTGLAAKLQNLKL